MASITAPGPTGRPAARNARAKPMTLSAMLPVGGLRWLIDVGTDLSHSEQRLVLAGRFLQDLLQAVALHADDVVLILQQRTQRIADHLRGQRACIELGDRSRP